MVNLFAEQSNLLVINKQTAELKPKLSKKQRITPHKFGHFCPKETAKKGWFYARKKKINYKNYSKTPSLCNLRLVLPDNQYCVSSYIRIFAYSQFMKTSRRIILYIGYLINL